MRKVPIILWLLLVAISCQKNFEYTPFLYNAEVIMQERPDSALQILRQINVLDLTREKDNAKYALLYSQALDKNYIDISDDSLINKAVVFYQKHGSEREQFLSLYYLGRVQFNAENYTQAIISYVTAESYIEKLNDPYLAGLLYTQIGEIYRIYNNYPSFLTSAKSAYNNYKKTEYSEYICYSLIDIGMAAYDLKQYDESYAAFMDVQKDAEKLQDTTLLALSYSNLAFLHDIMQEPSLAKTYLHKKYNLLHSFDEQDLACLAHIYSIEGHIDSVEICLNQAKNISKDKMGTAALQYTMYQIYKSQKNYKASLENFELCMQVQDSIARDALQESITTGLKNHFKKQTEFARYKLKMNFRIAILGVILFIIVILILVLYIYYRIKAKNIEISQYMERTYEIQSTMQQLSQDNTQKSHLIQQIFKEKFEFINTLGDTYYQRQSTKTDQIAIYNKVRTEFENLSSDKLTKAKLEQIINYSFDNVMDMIKNHVPQVKEADRELLCYLFAGFSYPVISVFTQDKIENIYNRKSRIRSKILNSDAKDKEKILYIISLLH